MPEADRLLDLDADVGLAGEHVQHRLQNDGEGTFGCLRHYLRLLGEGRELDLILIVRRPLMLAVVVSREEAGMR